MGLADREANDDAPLLDRFNETFSLRKRFIPSVLNLVSMPWYIFTVATATYIGLTECLPVLYDGCDRWILYSNQFVALFLLAEISMNYACMRRADVHYSPAIHDKHKHLKFGGTIHEATHEDMLSTHASRRRGNDNNNKQQRRPGAVFRLAINGSVDYETQKQISRSRDPTHTVALTELGGNGKKVYKIYPYWSWKKCVVCKVDRPPRVFHCPLCEKCILKRDHHCFFARCCVGLRNQRHFIVFSFWSFVTTAYVAVHATAYLIYELLPTHSYVDLFPPATFVRWCLGETSTWILLLCFLYYSVLLFCPLSGFFFYEQMALVRRGTTSFEEENRITLTKQQRPFSENVRGTFGKNWFLNFIVPCHKIWPCEDDGISWRTHMTSDTT